MKQPIYMLVAVPGTGKTWVMDQVTEQFKQVRHDEYIGLGTEAYVEAIQEAAQKAMKPVLIEAPFSISEVKDPLTEAGFKVIPLVIAESPGTLAYRYETDPSRSGPIPKGHLTRMGTYLQRAKQFGWFVGTTEQVLDHLKNQR